VSGAESVPGPGLFELGGLGSTPSPGFAAWLAAERVGLALTTGNRLVFVGRDGAGDVDVREHVLDGACGLAAVDAQTLYVAGRWQLVRAENALAAGQVAAAGHDRLFLTQTAHTTGFVGAVDAGVAGDGRVLFTNSLCNCVAAPSPRWNFTAVWRPPFISALLAEERCHITGLALDDGQLAYVTCAAETDVAGGWRDAVADGGVVLDVRERRVLARGLSLPRSPRLHDGRLYVAASGTGELVQIDRRSGESRVLARVPGLARGLAFSGHHAILGCSRVPEDGTDAQAPIAVTRSDEQRHGVAIVDLDTGAILATLWLDGGSGDLYGLVVLPSTVSPALGDGAGALRERFAIAPWQPPSWGKR
jgi:uncharacterized protein (TIGR03032 family)